MTTATVKANAHHTKTGGLTPRQLGARALSYAPPWCLACTAPAAGEFAHLAWGGDPVVTPLVTLTTAAATTGLSWLTWAVSKRARREAIIRWHSTITMALAGSAMTGTMVVGLPARPWADILIGMGAVTALSWNIRRFDALRSDTTDKDADTKTDTLTEKLGLQNMRFGKPKHHTDAQGNVVRVEVPVQHGPGETVEVLQGAVPAMESLADQAVGGGVPRGRSRAVPGDGAGSSTLVIVTRDMLATTIPWPGPSRFGGCITDPIPSGMYEDTQVVEESIAGGAAPTNTNYGLMGMTRAGKTVNMQIKAVEMMTRRNVVIFWLDQVKGEQTVRPILPGLDVVVLDDKPSAGRAALAALKRVIKARAAALGQCGYRKWTPAAYDDPRLRMPYLVVHIEEADALLAAAGDEAVFIASKCLSTGISLGISLQRAAATSMPTDLRFNVGAWNCFGCGDDYSAGFALSQATIDAGAHPEHWKQSKPGYFYHEGPDTPDQRWPVPARSFYAEDDELLAVSRAAAPHMAALDRVTIDALGDWYTAAKTATEQLRRDVAANPLTTTTGGADSSMSRANTTFDTPDDGDIDSCIAAEAQAARQDIAEMIATGEIELDPDDDAVGIDASKPVPAPAAGDELSWSGKGSAPTPEAAAQAFDRALREIADDPTLRDPQDPSVVNFQVATLVERYQFRSRPYFSDRLSKMADGQFEVPPGLRLERCEEPGRYRLTRLATVTALPNAQ